MFQKKLLANNICKDRSRHSRKRAKFFSNSLTTFGQHLARRAQILCQSATRSARREPLLQPRHDRRWRRSKPLQRRRPRRRRPRRRRRTRRPSRTSGPRCRRPASATRTPTHRRSSRARPLGLFIFGHFYLHGAGGPFSRLSNYYLHCFSFQVNLQNIFEVLQNRLTSGDYLGFSAMPAILREIFDEPYIIPTFAKCLRHSARIHRTFAK